MNRIHEDLVDTHVHRHPGIGVPSISIANPEFIGRMNRDLIGFVFHRHLAPPG
jgi:hypothetical protein